MQNNPGKDEKICLNCRYLLWMVGIGQGVRCCHPENIVDKLAPTVPNRRASCSHFEFRQEDDESDLC